MVVALKVTPPCPPTAVALPAGAEPPGPVSAFTSALVGAEEPAARTTTNLRDNHRMREATSDLRRSATFPLHTYMVAGSFSSPFMLMLLSDVPPTVGNPEAQNGAIVSLSLPGVGVHRCDPGEQTPPVVP